MITADPALTGREALLAATGHHPYARHALWRDQEARGWRRDGAVGWLLPPGQGPAGGALGAAGPALAVFAGLRADGTLRAGQSVHLPRTAPAEVAAHLPVARLDEWDFLWTAAPPPPQPAQERVVRLTEADHPALAALVEEAFPSSTSRPGDPRVVDWYGIRDGDRLVACGADRSRGDIGFVAGLTVAPGHRGRGLGAALTAGMAAALFARYDHVALGVYTANVGAIRLYRRLGFSGTEPRTSVHLG
ncbi:GNAT family N-acetyltransferase [Micromonospora sp. WMMA2032]|uniref:GNAT family N-acetyltransferase n=1 Tax=Micromonospora sp. WMMA2032 TaxID=2039870 RepID=UPI000C0589AE|nr:GNAT family N-acetyltransferase [Micromonospora sp. WMMA2032]ATO13788.1 GNAT family N-acetyltransferase [Micromonospora sp. WMMA2032]